ncbi:MAG TPA: ERCC4 domain-containing protein, partial [Polyangiaceae bacterium]
GNRMVVTESDAIEVLGAVPKGTRKAKVLPTIIVDQQEKLPLTRFFDPAKVRVEVAHLETGDYSLKGCTHLVAVERKGLADILECVTADRDRFYDQMRRLRDYPSRFLVVEATKATIEAGAYERAIKPSSVTGTLMSLAVRYNIVPVYCKDQKEAAERVQWILLKVAELKAEGFYKAYEESLGIVPEESNL